MVKKFLENKNAELLLAAQIIDSNEGTRVKRSSQRPNQQPTISKNKKSNKPHKLDVAKLTVQQREKNRRLARKKLRQSENGASNPENSRIRGSEGEHNSDHTNVTLPNTQPTLDRRAKRVSFA